MKRREGLLVTALAAGIVGLIWEIRAAHTPDLTPAEAARLISGTPEFNRRATTRAHADFYFRKGTWRLASVWWGRPTQLSKHCPT
jgi:hypothetical protein